MSLDLEVISACREAIANGEMMSDGRRPTVAAVEARLGRDITAEERDAAVEALEKAQAASEEQTGGDNVVSTNHDIEEAGRKESLIYIGPAIRRGYPVRPRTVFKSLPDPVAEMVEADPKLGRLFVPVSQYSASKRKMADTGSALRRAFDAVQENYGRVKA